MISTASDVIAPHPLGTKARVLLTSVFGPYARDDEFGSRAINPMELYHNQVTREQGSFSLRMFHRSWGLMMIQRNISAPSTLLDFPTLKRFEKELTSQEYDIVGISGIIPNFGKVREMCRRIRQLSPKSKIVVGGHVAAIPGIDKLIDADCVVRGEGIAWMRSYLGEDREPHQPSGNPVGIRHAGAGNARSRRHARYRSHDYPLRRMSLGLQFLHDFIVLWRQRKECSLLSDRRRTLRGHGADGKYHERQLIFHDGRKFSAEPAAGYAAASTAAGSAENFRPS